MKTLLRKMLRFAAHPMPYVRHYYAKYSPGHIRRQTAHTRRRESAVFAATEGRVADGPFQGMRFVEHATWGSAETLLAGCYEEQLREAVEELVVQAPSDIVNVGCADGYYAVGLALRLPHATVYAYDIDEVSRKACAEVANLNGVSDRVVVRGECTHAQLAGLVGPGTAMVVDCEGCEAHLLDPELVPALRFTSVLVELHDFINPVISKVIEERFSATHRGQKFISVRRDGAAVAAATHLSGKDRQAAVDESRPTEPPPIEWLWLTPNTAGDLHEPA